MRFAYFSLSLLILAAALPAMADDTVYATGSIWLAGQPSGTGVTGYFGADTAPANSPLLVNVTGGSLTFTASGFTSVDGSCSAGPDGMQAGGGACYSDQSSFSPSPWSSDYNGASNVLIGIFTDGTAPVLYDDGQGDVGPVYVAGQDYQSQSFTASGVYSPSLGQIFYIGTGAGETFTVPAGSTQLYLAVADSLGGSTGNTGSLDVTESFTGSVPSVTPEPSSLMLLGSGLFGGAAFLRRRRA